MEIDSSPCSSIISKDFANKMNLKIDDFNKELYTCNYTKLKILEKNIFKCSFW